MTDKKYLFFNYQEDENLGPWELPIGWGIFLSTMIPFYTGDDKNSVSFNYAVSMTVFYISLSLLMFFYLRNKSSTKRTLGILEKEIDNNEWLTRLSGYFLLLIRIYLVSPAKILCDIYNLIDVVVFNRKDYARDYLFKDDTFYLKRFAPDLSSSSVIRYLFANPRFTILLFISLFSAVLRSIFFRSRARLVNSFFRFT